MPRVALIQAAAHDDAASNLEAALSRIDEAAAQGAQIVCLQELFLGPYFCQEEDHAEFDRAEPVPGPTTDALAAKAQEHGIVIIGSLFEKRARGVYHNTAVILDADGSLAGVYRKMHIPDDPRFYEKFYFTPGDAEQGFPAFDTAHGRIAVLVCWDQWFPEAARAAALAGADVLFYPTAIGTWHGEMELKDEQLRAWQAVQRGHAVANGVYTVAVNRVGDEGDPVDGLRFWGHSFAFGPAGETLLELDDAEQVATVDLDFDAIEVQRRGWPFLRDRRVDAYGPLTKRWVD